MIIGIDVCSEKHYFRTFHCRDIELIRKFAVFLNSMGGDSLVFTYSKWN